MVNKTPFNLPIAYANLDFNQLENALIDFFKNNPDSPFRDYNHDGAGMKNVRKIPVYILHMLSFYLNMGISENYISRAILEDSIYKLIANFNFIPFAASSSFK